MTQTAALIGTHEAARRLDVSPTTVTRWAKAGRLEPVQKLPHTNGALVFDAAAVDALAEERAR